MFLLLFCLLCTSSFAFRLNVPRVLLPYHPTAQVKYNLIVSDPHFYGCFIWRSTRPDIVAVRPIVIFNQRCADRAQLVVTSKHAEEQTATILAESNGVVLSCGVTIDVIRNISIATTTRLLYLDASPTELTIQAFNGDGDMFTYLGGIPFSWTIEKVGAAEKSLQLIPFSKSKYVAPEGVADLEEIGKRGHVVLFEGMSPGEAVVKAELDDSFFKDVQPRSIELIVVTNLALIPSDNLFITPGSRVFYSAEIIKQSSTEKVLLPSPKYRLNSSNSSVCRINRGTSTVVAINLGSAEISLVDESLRTTHAIRHPSAYLTVVEPAFIEFLIDVDSWILAKDRNYTLSVVITDASGNVIFLSDRESVVTVIPDEYFHVFTKTKNGTYFVITPSKTGVSTISSSFPSYSSGVSIQGQKLITIMDPVVIHPALVLIPLLTEVSSDTKEFLFNLTATGGSGAYSWSSSKANIASVDDNGLIRAFRYGETKIFARDAKNAHNYGESGIHLSPAVKLIFSLSKLETEVGTTLELFPAILVRSLCQMNKDEVVYVKDCRQIQLSYSIVDETIFTLNKEHIPTLPTNGDGCTSVQLVAHKSGDTVIKMTYGNLSTSTYISSFPPLKAILTPDPLVMLGSTLPLELTGGPRPWILDTSTFYSQVLIEENTKIAKYQLQDRKHLITCGDTEGVTLINVAVGNRPATTNRLPVASKISINLCCSSIGRLALTLVKPQDKSSRTNVKKFCPVNAIVFHKEEKVDLSLTALGRCKMNFSNFFEHQFSSITSLDVSWRSDQPGTIMINELPRDIKNTSKIDAILEVQSASKETDAKMIGNIVVKSESYSVDLIRKKFQTAMEAMVSVLFVDFAHFKQSQVLIWNNETVDRDLEIIGGSGYFILENFNENIILASVNKSFLRIRPVNLGTVELSILDACLNNRVNLVVTVSDVEEILIDSPKMIEMNEDALAIISVRNSRGELFDEEMVKQMKIDIISHSASISIKSLDARKFQLHGISVGIASISAILRTFGDFIASVRHDVLVYTPFILLPKSITLIPGSFFQLEVQGGPQPPVPLHFNVDDLAVAEVMENGMIHSLSCGTASVKVGARSTKKETSESVKIKVVSLKGIKIRLSSPVLEKNGISWARIDGLSDDETPFTFGGAINSLDVDWSLNNQGIVVLESQLTPYIVDDSKNRFQINLRAVEIGIVMLKVRVRRTTTLEEHFSQNDDFLQDEVFVKVIESFDLVEPEMRVPVLRITPGSQIDLRTNRLDQSVMYVIPSVFSNIISLDNVKNGRLFAHSVGDAVVEMKHLTMPYSESKFLHVSVCAAESIHLELRSKLLLSSEAETLPLLPFGYDVHLSVVYRDRFGRKLIDTKSIPKVRPNRFDLTKIQSEDDQNSLVVTLQQVGTTVLSVYDSERPKMNCFVRLLAGDVLKPLSDEIYEEDIVCFRLLILSQKWEEVGSNNFEFVDKSKGYAVARSAGTSTILSSDSEGRKVLSVVSVASSNIFFRSHQVFISSIPGKEYVFPVVFGANALVVNIKGCTIKDLEQMEQVSAPFDCLVDFNRSTSVTARHVFAAAGRFIPTLNSYACVVKQQSFSGNPHILINETSLVLIVRARWIKPNKNQEASVNLTFYPHFMVYQDQIRLNNIGTKEDTLLIISPVEMMDYINVESSHPKILMLEHVRTSSTLLQYIVKLNVVSANLLDESLENCTLRVYNSYTEQLEQIPVHVTIHVGTPGMILKTLYLTRDIVYEFMKPQVFNTLAIIVASIFVLYLAKQKGYDVFSYYFGSAYEADPRTRDSFIGRNLSHERASRSFSSNYSRSFTPHTRSKLWSTDESLDENFDRSRSSL